ncbi:MAG TPA: T9SS type A sorting domain-containing protein, partial [Flavobacteriales bacterium]|nr:T9SS type A sorting domain-containing protein [Flavobacteriales bacterium]
PGGTALPGTACNDNNPLTGNDTWSASCVCAGQLIDCEGTPGGTALPGTACNDNNPLTGNDTWSASCVCAGQVIDCEGVAGGDALPGTPCDDGNGATTGDTWSQNCQCIGTPVGCDQSVVLVLTTDLHPEQTSWEIVPEGGGTPLCSGGPYPSNVTNSSIGEQCCLADGCYTLRVFDSAGDGMTTGGYVLKESGANGRRIIDNTADGVFGSVSAIAGGQSWCLPLGNDRLIFSACDKIFWTTGQYVVATANSAVSGTWVVGGSNAVQPSNSGYEFWIFDPDGTYSFRRFRSHNVSDGFSPASATRACHMKINSWLNTVSTPHIPANVLLNVRVRGRVAGQNFPFGPACRFKIDPQLAQCPPTALVNDPNNTLYSCGVTKPFGGTARLYAWSRPGATRYQFEFTLPGEGSFIKVVTTTSQYVVLNWTQDPLLPLATYNVRVRISLDQGQSWCPWGDVCLLTVAGNGSSGLQQAQQPGAVATWTEPSLTVWPNPNRGDRVQINLTHVKSDQGAVGLEIYDLYGKQVLVRKAQAQEGTFNTTLELGDEMTSGVYLLRVTVGTDVYTERVVIQR